MCLQSSRERYVNMLDPALKTEPWSADEDEKLLRLAMQYDCRWTEVAPHFEGRTNNSCYRRWRAIAPKETVRAHLARSKKSTVKADGTKRKWSKVQKAVDQPTELGRFVDNEKSVGARRKRAKSLRKSVTTTTAAEATTTSPSSTSTTTTTPLSSTTTTAAATTTATTTTT